MNQSDFQLRQIDVNPDDHNQTRALLGATAAAGAGVVALTAQPARADVTVVEDAINSLGTIGATALGIAVTPFVVYFAFKIVRRVMA